MSADCGPWGADPGENRWHCTKHNGYHYGSSVDLYEDRCNVFRAMDASESECCDCGCKCDVDAAEIARLRALEERAKEQLTAGGWTVHDTVNGRVFDMATYILTGECIDRKAR